MQMTMVMMGCWSFMITYMHSHVIMKHFMTPIKYPPVISAGKKVGQLGNQRLFKIRNFVKQ